MYDTSILLWLLLGMFGELICILEDMDTGEVAFITLADILIILGGPISLFFILRHHLDKLKIDIDV